MGNKGMAYHLIIAVAAVCISLGCCPGQDTEGQESPPTPALNGKVWKASHGTILKLNRGAVGGAVVDGDTVRLIGLDSAVRIIGIDTEELYRDQASLKASQKDFESYASAQRGDSLRPVKYGTPAGLAAKKFAADFFSQIEEVLFVTDNDLQPRGYYHRHLGHLLVDRDKDGVFEKNFAVEIVRNGYSPYFTKYGFSKQFRSEFERAEKEAREAKRGIWGAGDKSFDHYPDYDERLTWWHRRGKALERYDTLHTGKDSFFRMGLPTELARLKKALDGHPEGIEVVLFGAVKQVNSKKSSKVAIMSHKDSQDVAIYWNSDLHIAGKNEDFSPFEGELVYIKGLVLPSPQRRIGFIFRISGTDSISTE